MKETLFTPAEKAFMAAALREAEAAVLHGDIPVGAVVVWRDKIIAEAHNRREVDHDPTAHAEILALRHAGKALGHWRLSQAEMYVTLEPCPMCASAIVQSQFFRVTYALEDSRLGAAGSLMNLLQFPGFHHDVRIRSGLLAEESLNLLQGFFSNLR